ncbi:lysM and putative peptidoglycan-binding domain-containing protein 2 [Brachyhypopomus gauderio]|uniref:lysM and putative peptidoglycan-binding domain-containing protein 2 n=1 Tax=Brachyhypopomus gauderio TaxID=698409 RepID=UPI0040417439
MAEFSPVLSLRDGGGRFGQPLFPRSRSGSESESELSQSLARTKTRSYGSTASVTATLGEKYIEHRVADGDTLQGIALKYGVTMEQIKRANKLFSSDCVFMRHSLNIPVQLEKPSLFNGLSLESPDACVVQETPLDPSPQTEETASTNPVPRPPPPDELSAKDYLQMLDLQINRSKQVARKLKEEGCREEEDLSHPQTSS